MKKAFPHYRTTFKIITVTIPLIAIGLFIFQNSIFELLFRIPPCPFYRMFHLYCPACGNTRSVTAFLNGHFLSALRYNISPILFFILFVCAYIEFASYNFGHPIRILPRKGLFYITGASLLVAYILIRNFVPFLTP